ncbi:hypothetical protein B0H21DRAFT_794386 [Amylocystis lapponica]|nr:hypothetical protein B0H21DRAFT_794386 [Amylocystis lapponica]
MAESATSEHTSSSSFSNLAARKEDNPALRSRWASEVEWKINPFDGSFDHFLETFLPSTSPCPELALHKPFTGLNTAAKFKEPAIYEPLIQGLRSLVQEFPADKRLEFVDSHANQLDFPLSQWAKHHGKTAPDISALQPGKPYAKVKRWQQVSLVFEAKNSLSADPTKIQTEKDVNTRIQLAKNARNMLIAHGALSCFVVGVYARQMRIFHFDHAAAVASPPFDYIRNPRCLQHFLWRFVHPAVGRPVVGRDETISVPLWDQWDVKWAEKQWKKLRGAQESDDVEESDYGEESEDGEESTDEEGFKFNCDECRVVSVPSTESGKEMQFLTIGALGLNPCLFSRATVVRVAISHDPNHPLVAIKDAWRQRDVRERETQFYIAMSEYFKEHDDEKPWGLPTMLCGVDFGDIETPVEVARPEPSSSRRYSESSHMLVGAVPVASSSSRPSTSRQRQQLATTLPTPNRRKRNVKPVVKTAKNAERNAQAVAQLPLSNTPHRTMSAFYRSCITPDLHNRNHMRIVVDLVGRSLDTFQMTQEFAWAFLDTIKGHMQAYKMGILHRDVSEGNIMIVDGQPFRGFIHDFDYSSFYRKAMDELKASGELSPPKKKTVLTSTSHRGKGIVARHKARREEKAREQLNVQNAMQAADAQPQNELKERTGTLRFMAIDFLSLRPGEKVVHLVQHDLESFYWVFIWIVLRHTRHEHPDGVDACRQLFDKDSERSCKLAKLDWLTQDRLVVKDNDPLTNLVGALTDLVEEAHPTGQSVAIPLTYETIIEVFEILLEEDGWPADDKAIPFKPVDTSKEVPAQKRPDTGVPSVTIGTKRAATEYPASQKRQRMDDGSKNRIHHETCP